MTSKSRIPNNTPLSNRRWIHVTLRCTSMPVNFWKRKKGNTDSQPATVLTADAFGEEKGDSGVGGVQRQQRNIGDISVAVAVQIAAVEGRWITACRCNGDARAG